MKRLFVMLPAILTIFCMNARAEDPVAGGAKTKIIFKKSESHRFSGSQLKGQLKKPELSYIYERKGLKQEQIVNIPENFNDEIIEGAGQF